MNYDAQAKRIANDLRQQVGEPRRGVLFLEESGVCAVFAKDNYRLDPRTRDEVRRLFCDAHQQDIQILGFAVDDLDGACWAMVAACDNPEWLDSRLDAAFRHAHGFDSVGGKS